MRNRRTHPRYGDQCACELCGLDIEYHGPPERWIDRGSNTHCDTGGAARRWDEDGQLVPFPHIRHRPPSDF